MMQTRHAASLLLALLAAWPGAAPAHAAFASRGEEPVLRLQATASFLSTPVRAGDTARYRIRVEWADVPAAVMLLPPVRLEAPGLEPAGREIVHRKTTGPDGSRNLTEITYAFVARTPGAVRIAPSTLRYHNGLSGREETVGLPGALLEVSPPAASRALFAAACAALAGIIALAGFLAWKASRKRRAGTATGNVPDPGPATPWASGLEALRRRCDPARGGVADPRAWLADAEALCTRALCTRIGVNDPSHVRFEAALDRYLARKAEHPAAEAHAWATLRDLFHEARYAGATPGAEALRSACHHLQTCLGSLAAPQGDTRT